MTNPKLVDMAYTPAEIAEKNRDVGINRAVDPTVDPYPWGLTLRLGSESLDKLGIDELPAVGDEFHMVAIVKVTSVHQHAGPGGDDRNVEMQVTDMGVFKKEDEKPEEVDSAKTETREDASILGD